MHDHEKSDRPVLPVKPPNKPGDRGRRWWREGACPRGTRPVKHVPDAVPDWACPGIWIVCARWRGRTGMCGSPRSFITSASIACGRRIGRSARAPRGGRRGHVAGLRAGSRGEPSRSARPCPQRGVSGETDSEGVHTEAGRAAAAARGRVVGGQDPPAGGGRGVECRFTSRTFSGSRTGSGRGARSMMRWTRSSVGITRKKVSYVLDADISDFFTSLDQSWLESSSSIGSRTAGSCG